jgi:hypothetical protein
MSQTSRAKGAYEETDGPDYTRNRPNLGINNLDFC